MSEEENPYLQMRAAKIARNEARLAELGLLKQPTAARSGYNSRKAATTKTRNKKEKQLVQLPKRRSSRLAEIPIERLEPTSPAATRRAPIRMKRPRPSEITDNSSESTEYKDDMPPTLPSVEVSARNMSINTNQVVAGILGREMDAAGKAAVMLHAARTITENKDINSISFNKYSGVQEWQNDVLFLWVNLGAPNSEVVNEFLQGGRQITWFGGSRMTDETRVIRRLIRVGRKCRDKHDSSNGEIGIVLWARLYNKAAKKQGPYVCLGRLSYHAHVPGSRPLEFVWNLVDHDELVGNANESVRARFQSMVEEYGEA